MTKMPEIIGDISQEELDYYIARAKREYKGEIVKIVVDGDYVDIDYKRPNMPFDRIRRITGYLVGTMDRWNDAKRSEEHDRVKHNIL